jgi:hypothetical protein
MDSLCPTCRFVRVIVSGKGSQFLLCEKAAEDQRFVKYPPQPVVRCGGYEERQAGRLPHEISPS